MNEREITEQVSLTRNDGRLNLAAIGWSRTPLHHTDRIGRGLYGRGRNKRWEYWAITTPTHVVALTISDIDYAGLLDVWVLDRATKKAFGHHALSSFARGIELPGTLGAGPARGSGEDLAIDIDEVVGGTRLRVRSPRVEVDVVAHRPAGHECLGVVVPWSQRIFQYTVKDVARPATGRFVIDGTDVEFPEGGAWATLDHGRGRWPYAVTWNWGAGSGTTDGKVIGVQVGGKWTDGTGSVENALVVDGRLTKISNELDWAYDTTDWMKPWQVCGQGVDLTFTPEYVKKVVTSRKIVSSRTHQAFGDWSGRVRDEAGEWVRVQDVFGWAEEVHQRW